MLLQSPAAEAAKRREERSPEPVWCIILPRSASSAVLLSRSFLIPGAAPQSQALQDGLGWQAVGSPSTGGPLVGPNVSGTGGVLIFYWS